MRARNIKPGFYKNDELAECSVWARLLAPGLWMLADREGRLKDRPLMIKAEIFPFDEIDVDPLLRELHHANHIIRYEIDGRQYIQIPSFLTHQKPHIKEKHTLIPDMAPTQTGASTNLGSVEHQPRQLPALPSSLNPESLNEESCSLRSQRAPKKKSVGYSPEFESFWIAYPKNGASKSEAAKSYAKAINHHGEQAHDLIIAATAAYGRFVQSTGTPVAHATTWLNQQRWTIDHDDLARDRIAAASSVAVAGRNQQASGFDHRDPATRARDEGERIIAERHARRTAAASGTEADGRHSGSGYPQPVALPDIRQPADLRGKSADDGIPRPDVSACPRRLLDFDD